MKKFLFENWHQWRVCFLSGCSKFCWGLWRIITCILFGVVSVFVYMCKQVNAFCRREKVASFIVGTIIVFGVLGWISSFAKERSARINAEHERDSLSLKLDSARQNGAIRDSMVNFKYFRY